MKTEIPNRITEQWCKNHLELPEGIKYRWPDAVEEGWALGPDIEADMMESLDISNAQAMVKMFEDRKDLNYLWKKTNLGRCTYLSFEVYDEKGNVSPAAILMAEIEERLEEYPVLDDEDYQEREHEENLECWSNYACREFEKALEFHFDLELDEVFSNIDQFKLYHELTGEWWDQHNSGKIDMSSVTAEDFVKAIQKLYQESLVPSGKEN